MAGWERALASCQYGLGSNPGSSIISWLNLLIPALLRGLFQDSGLSPSSKTHPPKISTRSPWKQWRKSLSVECATATVNCNFIYLLVVYFNTRLLSVTSLQYPHVKTFARYIYCFTAVVLEKSIFFLDENYMT